MNQTTVHQNNIMIRPILAVFAIVAIAAMMGASTVAPAYADTLIVDEVTLY